MYDLVGRRYGRLLVLTEASPRVRRYGRRLRKERRWGCICRCGRYLIVPQHSLIACHATSCGCGRFKYLSQYGERALGSYKTWQAMINRCRPSASHRAYYKRRGIYVCERWLFFDNFFADMGPRPTGLTLDRIDNNRPYTPDNCRWATRAAQVRNRRNNILLTLDGITLTAAEWARRVGISAPALRDRLKKGWSDEDALTLPANPPASRRRNIRRKLEGCRR